LHCCGAVDFTVSSDCGVGELHNRNASASRGRKSVAVAGHINGLASSINFGAKTLLTFSAAGNVRHGCLIRNSSAGGRGLLQPLVDTRNGATMARANTSTVKNVLNGQVNINALASNIATSSDLDTITKGGNSTMRPAGATVLRKVLISANSAIIDSIVGAPVQRRRNSRRRDNARFAVVAFDSNVSFHLTSPNFAWLGLSIHIESSLERRSESMDLRLDIARVMKLFTRSGGVRQCQAGLEHVEAGELRRIDAAFAAHIV